MGNRSSRTRRATARSTAATQATVLSERDAWAIATTWHPQLLRLFWLGAAFPAPERLYVRHGRLRHRVEPSDTPFSIVATAEYVDFSFSVLESNALERAVSAARAAMIVWFALSCCPGFSGQENPQFWWRVLSPTPASHPVSTDPWERAHLVDSHHFFPHAERPFPRFRIRSSHPPSMATLLNFQEAAMADKKLMSILRKLEPFICKTRQQRGLCVAICGGVEWFSKSIHHLPPRDRESQLQEPRRVEMHHLEESSIPPTDLDTLIATTDTKVCFSTSYEMAYVNRHCDDLLLLQERASGSPRVRIQTLDLSPTLSRNSDSYFAECCSALPHTRAVTGLSVRLLSADGRGSRMDDLTAAWLGYAIFHPGATRHSTSFTDLTIEWRSSDRAAFGALASMALGNNLLVAMGVTTTTSGAYHQVRLRAGTQIRREPTGTDAHEEGVTCPSDVWVTACVTHSPPPLATDTSIRVVFPGRGIGWVDTNDILDVVERPPGECCVRRLRFLRPEVYSDTGGRYNEVATREYIVQVLSVLGRHLEFLELVPSPYDVSVETLRCVLEQCPNLKSLRVTHNGFCWSGSNELELPTSPRLEELELVLHETLQPLTAPQLAGLRVLKINAATPGYFRANRQSFLTVLEQCLDLQVVVWRSDRGRLVECLDVQQQEHALTMLNQVITRGVHDVARVPFSVAARLAFLSVPNSRPDHPMGRGSPDIWRHLFSFSSSLAPRQFHILDNV